MFYGSGVYLSGVKMLNDDCSSVGRSIYLPHILSGIHIWVFECYELYPVIQMM